MFSTSIPCIGCERRIQCEFEVYCLDCEHAISELEEYAFNEGYTIGLTARPIFHSARCGFAAKFIVASQINIEDVIHSSTHTFVIHYQHLRLKNEVKQLHFHQAFLDGYTEGYKTIYSIYLQYRLVLQDFMIDLGKRQAGVLLLSYILYSDKVDRQMVDYNLVPFIKKFIP